MPLIRHLQVRHARNPAVLSYHALRQAVGWIAVCLPVALLLSSWIVPSEHGIPFAISAYYYTPMRDVLVGSLCAIAFFNLSARGYDWRDEVAGMVSAISALGLAFCPTWPPGGGGRFAQLLSEAHHLFAETFFATLAIMCLALFRTTAANRPLTRAKRRRNTIYLVCGIIMVVCGVVDFICQHMRPIPQWGPVGSIFCCEFVALEAFGIAWLVKGKTFRKNRRLSHSEGASSLAPAGRANGGVKVH
ncbi:MAG TPA: hypothetical protein VGS02_00155 [Acidobacteriaceae bacterium]|nr:hypothetical protein [Acidobacteriaceae bacterium]